MDKGLETYDLFLRFTKKQLSEKEIADFESKLSSDTSFKQEYDDYELSRNFVLNKEMMEVKNLIAEVEAGRTSNNALKYWAGGLVVLISAGVMYFNISSSYVSEDAITSTDPIESQTEIIEKEKSFSLAKENPLDHSTPTEHRTIAKEGATKQLIIEPEETKAATLVDGIDLVVPVVESIATIATSEETNDIDEAIPTLKTPCLNLIINTTNKSTCNGESNGEISISNVKNAKAPITYALEDDNYSSNTIFDYLEKGTYGIKAKDADGCTHEKQVKVESKWCLAKHYEISYVYDSHWSIPIQELGKVEIFSRGGNIVTEFTLSNDEDTEWDGLSKDGEKLTIGLYTFIIITDSKKTYTGSISVLE